MFFAKLFGREIGGRPTTEVMAGKAEIKTHADLLHRIHSDAHLISIGDVDAKDRRKSKKPAATLSSAIFG